MIFKPGFRLVFILAALCAPLPAYAVAPEGEAAEPVCGELSPCNEQFTGESYDEADFEEVYDEAPAPSNAEPIATPEPVVPAVTDESGLIEDAIPAEPLPVPETEEVTAPKVLETPADTFMLEETAEESAEAPMLEKTVEVIEPIPERVSKRWWGRPY